VLPEVTVDDEVTPADPRNAALVAGGVAVPLDFTDAAGKPLKRDCLTRFTFIKIYKSF
jgi:hypothetical protein